MTGLKLRAQDMNVWRYRGPGLWWKLDYYEEPFHPFEKENQVRTGR